LASHSTEEAPNPSGASHRVTSEPLKKKNPITVGQAQQDKGPEQVLYKTIDCATTDATQRQDLGYCDVFAFFVAL